MRSHSAWYSCSEPSHQNTRSGWHSLTISSTHASRAEWFVFRFPSDSVVIIILFGVGPPPYGHVRRARNYALIRKKVKQEETGKFGKMKLPFGCSRHLPLNIRAARLV